MTTTIEEFVARVGWEVDSTQLKKFEKSIAELGSMVKTAALSIGAAAGATVAFTVAQNKQTTALLNTAKAYGINAESLENYSMLLGDIGVSGEGVANMMVGLGQKVSAVVNKLPGGERTKKVLDALGLDNTTLAGMDPQKRFETVLTQLQKMPDAAKAGTIAERLLGGDGAKTVGYLRAGSVSIQELVAGVSDLNLQTEEGREGALGFFGAFDDLEDSFTSFRALAAGLIGGALTPMLEDLKTWVKQNRELIQSKASEWAKDLASGLKSLWGFLVNVATASNSVAKAFGGWFNVAKMLIGLRIGAWLYQFGGALAGIGKAAFPGSRLFNDVAGATTGSTGGGKSAGAAGGAGALSSAAPAKKAMFSGATLPLIGALGATVVDAFKAFGKNPQDSGIVQAYQGVMDWLIETEDEGSKAIRAKRKELMAQGVSAETLDDMGVSVESYFANRKKKIANIMDEVGEDLWGTILGQVKLFGDILKGAMVSVGNVLAEAAKSVWGGITGFFGSIGSAITGALDSFMMAIASALEGLPLIGDLLKNYRLGREAGKQKSAKDAADAAANADWQNTSTAAEMARQATNTGRQSFGGRDALNNLGTFDAQKGFKQGQSIVNIPVSVNAESTDSAAVGRAAGRKITAALDQAKRNAK